MHSSFVDKLIPALTWTLVHSLWQGLVLTVLASVVLLLTRRTTAALRYALLCALFFCFLVGVLGSFLLEWTTGYQPADQRFAIATSANSLSPSLVFGKLTEQVTFFLNANAQWIVLSWLFVFLFRSVRMIKDLVQVGLLRTQNILAARKDWTVRVQLLASELGIRKTVPLIESARVSIPVVIGYFKPLILVPVGLLNHLPPGEVEAVLLHELAHIRRHDYLVNVIQRIAEAVLFFNPGLLWVSSLLRAEGRPAAMK
jgi:beta-lactamase regulating signal transducer with metallopeptidase domain